MRKIYAITVWIILIVLSSCSREEFIDNKLPNEQVISELAGKAITFTAITPDGDDPKILQQSPIKALNTRIALEKDALENVQLTWEDGDQLHLVLVYNVDGEEKTDAHIVDVTNISEDRKKADFSFILPSDVTETFNLYGIYGGGGLDIDNPKLAILPTNDKLVAGTLAELQANKAVILRFATTVDTSSPVFSVNFEHVGSLFNIQLENTGTSALNNIQHAKLVSQNPIGIHNNLGSAKFDVVSGVFSGTELPNELLFKLPSPVNLDGGATTEFWSWYPPVEFQVWPSMSLEVLDSNGNTLATSTNGKASRSISTAVGKAFYFFTEWDGSTLSFDSGFDLDAGSSITVVKDFEDDVLGATYPMTGNSTATVVDDPDGVSGKVLNIGNNTEPANQSFPKIEITLPEGKTLAQVQMIIIDFKATTSTGLIGAGMRMAINENSLVSFSTASSFGCQSNVWGRGLIQLPVENFTEGEKGLTNFRLTIGSATGTGNYYIDNISIKWVDESAYTEKLMIDFESEVLGKVYEMHKTGEGAGIARVVEDPDGISGKVLRVGEPGNVANYSIPKFHIILPPGRTLDQYESVSVDMRVTNSTGRFGNGMELQINGRGKRYGSPSTFNCPDGAWGRGLINLSLVDFGLTEAEKQLTSFELAVGTMTGSGDYYIDNITLTKKE